MGRRAIYERDAEEGWNLYVRDTLEQLYTRDAEAEPFLDGGAAKGGDSKTKGGNRKFFT